MAGIRSMAAVAMLGMALGQPLCAQSAEPLRTRPIGSAQADGQLHTLRTIPEACVRLQGQFGGPDGYALAAVPSAPGCQPRAQFRGVDSIDPDPAAGWLLDEIVRVPSARCPQQMLRLELWTLPVAPVQAPRDGQGQVRIYLEQAQQGRAAGAALQRAQWTARWGLDGRCARPAVPDPA